MATSTVTVHPAHNQPTTSFPPLFFNHRQIARMLEILELLGGDRTAIELVPSVGGATWMPR